MKRILLINFMLMSALISQVWAQERTISGTVTSAEEEDGLPGVNVIVSGTTLGTTTDLDGNYNLTVPEDATTIEFSFIGFETQEVTIGNRSEIDVQLVPDIRQLSEVVVTALGIEREARSLGYSVEQVDGDELSQARETNIVNSLSGKVAGVNITPSGTLGGSSRIVIRGANSITGNNEPLFIVDGVPIDNSNFTSANQARGGGGFDYGNAAQDINPDDIKSISVLKGPSAAALYGARAANGVILITTKTGAGTKGIGISVNSGVTIDRVYNLPDYQNLYGGGANKPFAVNDEGQDVVDFATDESWGPRLDGRPVRQWYSYDDVNGFDGQATPWVAYPGNVEDFFETGTTVNNNIALTGANETGNFRLSYTNVQQNGVFPNSNLEKNSLNFNGGLNLTEKLTTSVNVNYIYSEAIGRPGTGYSGGNVMQQFNHFGQRQEELDSYMRDYLRFDGSQRGWNWRDPIAGTLQFSNNPYWVRYKNYQNDHRERLYGNFNVTYQFTDFLSLQADVRTDVYTDRREERIASGSQEVPLYSEGIREVKENNYELMLTFDKNITTDLSLNAFIGGNVRHNKYYRNVLETQGGLSVPDFYNIENSNDRPFVDDFFQQEQVQSVFGSASFGYRDIVYLDGTLRNDWSSTLPEDNNSYLYPSATSSFVFTELPALSNFNVLSFGKLRVGWAQVGNDTDPYNLEVTYTPVTPFGANPYFTVPSTLNNSDLRPENTSSWEFGTTLQFFNNRLGLDVTYYDEVTTDQIFPVAISTASGYSAKFINAGEITNKGVEILLNATPVQIDNGFRWDVSLNWSTNESEVVELSEGIDTYVIGSAPFGVSIVAKEGEPYGTLLGTDFIYDDNGNKIVDEGGGYLTTDAPVSLGSITPDWLAGVQNTFSYKGISASFLINGQKGGDLYSITSLFGLYSGMLEETAANNIREVGVVPVGVTESGEDFTGQVGAEAYFKGLFGIKRAHVYDASYVKLREVRIGYTFPESLFGNLPFTNITLSAVGRNLAILHKNVPHIDPETALSSGNVQGIEAGQIPPVRSFGFNLSFGL